MVALNPVQVIAPLMVLVMAVLARAERKLVARLRNADATSPDHAVDLGPLRGIAALRLQRLTDSAAVIALPDGRHFLDVDAWERYRAERRRRVAAVVIVVVFAAAIVLLLAR